MLSNLIPNLVTEKYLKHESGIILANPIMTKMKYLERGFQLLYFRCPILNSNIKWTLTIPSIIHWRGRRIHTYLYSSDLILWNMGTSHQGSVITKNLLWRVRKKIFVEKQNSWKMKYSRVPCKHFQKIGLIHILTWILECIGLKKYSTSSI